MKLIKHIDAKTSLVEATFANKGGDRNAEGVLQRVLSTVEGPLEHRTKGVIKDVDGNPIMFPVGTVQPLNGVLVNTNGTAFVQGGIDTGFGDGTSIPCSLYLSLEGDYTPGKTYKFIVIDGEQGLIARPHLAGNVNDDPEAKTKLRGMLFRSVEAGQQTGVGTI
jgi:hypothetical protein